MAKAEDLTGAEKTKMLEVAQAWLKVADEAAKEAAKAVSPADGQR